MPKVSVIIPVYNVAEYLPQCIESVGKDAEIICINDGSTDNSLEVLQRYPGVKIIDKANEGSGAARNEGLKAAAGKYVFFLDGDDWFMEGALEKMTAAADKDDLDMLIFGGWSCAGKNRRHGGYSYKKIPKFYLDRVFCASEIKAEIFKFPSTAWTKLYRREFLLKNNIQFQEIKVGQDQLFFFHSMITAQRIAVLPENLYCYRKNRMGSAMTVKKKKNFSPIYVFYGIEELLLGLGRLDEYKGILVDKYFSKATSWLGKFDDETKHEYFKEYARLLEHVKSQYPGGWQANFNPCEKDSYLMLKMKIFCAKMIKKT
jgi:glycosyltransferase involved in cell wall biosynthesis